MTTVRDRMLKRFLGLKLLHKVSPSARLEAFWTLADKYDESHRRYHVLEHIEFGFQIFDQFRHLAKNPNALDLAWFCHDFFYDIGVPPRQNEEFSTLMLVEMMLGWGCLIGDIYDASSAVLATTHDHTPSTNDNKLIVDIDLAGLGAPWEVFLQNNLNIREEYRQVSEADFRAGNSKILRQFLDRKPLYYHPEIEAQYGAQARANLSRWLNRP